MRYRVKLAMMKVQFLGKCTTVEVEARSESQALEMAERFAAENQLVWVDDEEFEAGEGDFQPLATDVERIKK